MAVGGFSEMDLYPRVSWDQQSSEFRVASTGGCELERRSCAACLGMQNIVCSSIGLSPHACHCHDADHFSSSLGYLSVRPLRDPCPCQKTKKPPTLSPSRPAIVSRTSFEALSKRGHDLKHSTVDFDEGDNTNYFLDSGDDERIEFGTPERAPLSWIETAMRPN